jgi:hypothetical protein
MLIRRLLLILCLAASGAVEAGTFSVDVQSDTRDVEMGNGVCRDAEGHCSLRAAVQEANATLGGDSILLPAGTYLLTLSGTDEDAASSGDLDVDDDLVLIGAGAEVTSIDGGAIDRVLDVRPSPFPRIVRIENLTLRNGLLASASASSNLQGAGLRVGRGVDATLYGVDIRDNRLGTLLGAIGIENSGCLRGTYVRVANNTYKAPPGAARALVGGIATAGLDSCLLLEDSEISGNRASHAGALYVDDSASVTLRRTLIALNEAPFSALLLNNGDTVLLESVTISGNIGSGSAILNDGFTHLTLLNSTVTGNHAAPPDMALVGGIQDVHGGFGLTFLSNTILSGNGPGLMSDDCMCVTSLDGGNIIGNSERCQASTRPTDLLDVAPNLGPLADNGGFTRTHLPGKGAIDRGVRSVCPSDDQRGMARPLDGDGDGSADCDVGAVEARSDTIFVDNFEIPARP